MIEPGAFTVNVSDSVLTTSEAPQVAGPLNLVKNGDFEQCTVDNSTTIPFWTSSDFQSNNLPTYLATQSPYNNPPVSAGQGGWSARTYALSYAARTATLLSDLTALGATGARPYYVGFWASAYEEIDQFGTFGTYPLTNITLTATVRWYAANGTTLLREDPIYSGFPAYAGTPVVQKITSPAGAAYAKIYFAANEPAWGTNIGGMYFYSMLRLDSVFLSVPATRAIPAPRGMLEHRGIGPLPAFTDLSYGRQWRGGFKDASFKLYGDPDYLLDWVKDGLTRHLSVGYMGQTVFEGGVVAVEGMIRGIPYRVSMDEIFNYVRLEVDGDTPVAVLGDLDSRLRYGFKQWKEQTALSGNDAHERAATILRRHKAPRASFRLSSLSGDDNCLTISAQGYWGTLNWLPELFVYVDYPPVDSSYMATQIIVNARNYGPFISDDFSRVEKTGISITAGQLENNHWNPSAPVQNYIERYLGRGNSAGDELDWGVWEDRQFMTRSISTKPDYFVTPGPTPGTYRYYDANMQAISGAFLLPGRWMAGQRAIPDFDTSASIGERGGVLFLSETRYDTEKDKADIVTPDDPTLIGLLVRLAQRDRRA